MKKCSKCGQLKDLNKFHKDKNIKDGLTSRCGTCRTKYMKDDYIKNPEKYKKRSRIYKSKNKDKTNKREKEKKFKSPLYRLNKNVSSAISHTLKGNKNGWRWESLVGYTQQDLRIHLEKQFKKGMTWANYGDWHIDHIIPISVFNFKKPEHFDFKRCWALKNLQPSWKIDNLKKYNKLEKPFQPSLNL